MMRLKLLTGLFIFLYGNVVQADYDAADLKDLFTNKSQRVQIDAARSGNSPSGEVRQTSIINVSGYVTRSDGKSVVWVNDKNTLESSKLGNVRVHQSSIGKNKKVTVTVEGKSQRLKAGQTWDKESDKVVDNHQ